MPTLLTILEILLALAVVVGFGFMVKRYFWPKPKPSTIRRPRRGGSAGPGGPGGGGGGDDGEDRHVR